MKHLNQKFLLDQISKKTELLSTLKDIELPESGWISSLRKSLKMPLKHLAERLKIAAPTAKQMELREKTGAITIKTMNDVAEALNMQFVYGFVPKEESMQKMIKDRANEIAQYVIQERIGNVLSDDKIIEPEKINSLIKETSVELKRILPRYFWSDDKDEWIKGSIKLIDLQNLFEEKIK